MTFRAVLLAGLLAFPLPSFGQAAPSSLESSLDQIITQHMARTHLPGVVVAVVRDGRVLFLKGYGYSDLAARRPVVPDHTVFRVGSVSSRSPPPRCCNWPSAVGLGVRPGRSRLSGLPRCLESVDLSV